MMANDEPGFGERAGKARRRRISGVIAGLMLAGAATGLITSLFSHEGGGDMLSGALPGWAAIASAVILVVAMSWGSWKFFQVVDEVELRDNYLASMIGLYFYMIGYAVWYLLWWGGLVPEPGHEALFIGTFAVATLTYLWKKLRP